MSIHSFWAWLNEPRPSRGYVAGWGCPGDGCSGVFRTRERAQDHGAIARVIGRTSPATAHDTGPQRRARRARDQALRQLRGQR